MRSSAIKTFSIIIAAALIGCAGCRPKSGSSPGPVGESEGIGEPAEPSADAAGDGDKGEKKEIKNVYWSQVAGQFYPFGKKEVEDLIDKYMKDTRLLPQLEKRDIVGFISPHAGYAYAGPVAAWGYRQIRDREITTAVILGFSHSGAPSVSSILPYDGYKTPLGVARVDGDIRKLLVDKGEGILEESESPFKGEHSLETQVPFIQKALPGVSIVPIMVAHPGGKVDDKLAGLLFDTLGNRKDVVFIASTDLSHYMPYDDAVAVDTETLEWIAGQKWSTIDKAGHGANRMCGYFTTGVLMKLFSYYEAKDRKGTLVKYANSGDTSGNMSKGVVGYGIVAFSLPEGVRTEEKAGSNKSAAAAAASDMGMRAAVDLTGSEKTALEKTARASIEASLGSSNYVPGEPAGDNLKKKMGSIVSIEIDGRIQGTGMELSLGKPLYASVSEAARNAVLNDPRYPTPSPAKLAGMKIRIYTVSAAVPAEDFKVEDMEGSGLLVSGRWGEGIVYPDEAARNGWKNETAARCGCRRASLMPDCYKESNRKKEKLTFTLLKGAAL
ncbi:MAG: AmmeMemoRadiSam system protein B [Pseudomonadota bacterium]